MNTENALITVSTQSVNTKNRGRSVSRKPKEEWTMPVSKNFYNRLLEKAEKILRDIRSVPGMVEHIRRFIDNYLTMGKVPTNRDVRYSIFVVFTCLRPEIDAAMARSAAARRRAAERREAKKATSEPLTVEAADAAVYGLQDDAVKNVGAAYCGYGWPSKAEGQGREVAQSAAHVVGPEREGYVAVVAPEPGRTY